MKDRNKSSSSFTDTQLELVKDEQKKVDAYKNRIIWSDETKLEQFSQRLFTTNLIYMRSLGSTLLIFGDSTRILFNVIRP